MLLVRGLMRVLQLSRVDPKTLEDVWSKPLENVDGHDGTLLLNVRFST